MKMSLPEEEVAKNLRSIVEYCAHLTQSVSALSVSFKKKDEQVIQLTEEVSSLKKQLQEKRPDKVPDKIEDIDSLRGSSLATEDQGSDSTEDGIENIETEIQESVDESLGITVLVRSPEKSAEVEDKYDSGCEEPKEFHSQILHFETIIEALRSQRDEDEKLINDLEQQVSVAKEKEAETKKNYEEQISSIMKTVDELQSANEVLLQEKEQLEEKNASDTRRLQELTDRNDLVEEQIQDMEADHIRLLGHLQARDVIVADLEKKLQEAQSDGDGNLAQMLYLQDSQDTAVKLGIKNTIEDILKDELVCAICTDNFTKATTLGCAHTFCERCVAGLSGNQICPVCRSDILSRVLTPTIDSVLDKMNEKCQIPSVV